MNLWLLIGFVMETVFHTALLKSVILLFFFSFLDVHPGSICEKLGTKYVSVPVNELKNHSDFFEDFLRYSL